MDGCTQPSAVADRWRERERERGKVVASHCECRERRVVIGRVIAPGRRGLINHSFFFFKNALLFNLLSSSSIVLVARLGQVAKCVALWTTTDAAAAAAPVSYYLLWWTDDGLLTSVCHPMSFWCSLSSHLNDAGRRCSDDIKRTTSCIAKHHNTFCLANNKSNNKSRITMKSVSLFIQFIF